jgi:hypothetical protein
MASIDEVEPPVQRIDELAAATVVTRRGFGVCS